MFFCLESGRGREREQSRSLALLGTTGFISCVEERKTPHATAACGPPTQETRETQEAGAMIARGHDVSCPYGWWLWRIW